MKARATLPLLLCVATVAYLFQASAAFAALPKTVWTVQSVAEPTNFKPGEESGLDTYEAFITNSGGEVTNGDPITIVDTLPPGVGVASLSLQVTSGLTEDIAQEACQTEVTGETSIVTCTVDDSITKVNEPTILHPDEQMVLAIHTKVPPSVSGGLINGVEVSGGGAPRAASASSHNEANAGKEAPAGLQEFSSRLSEADGSAAIGAASHPYEYLTSFALDTEAAPPGSNSRLRPSEGDLRNIEVPLPPGLIANPMAVERCPAAQFNTVKSVTVGGQSGISLNECPDASAVGVIAVRQLEGDSSGGVALTPIYNLVPPQGMPAQLGFQLLGLPIYINAKLRSDGDYGVTGYLKNTSEAKRVTAAQVMLWGTPWDGVHDRLRGHCAQTAFAGFSCPAQAGAPRPLWRLPSSCASELPFSMSFDTWLHPGSFISAGETSPAPVGCELPPFDPSFEAAPTTDVADAPSGLHFDLHFPQRENEDPEGLAEVDLRDAAVTLPQGFVVNPSSADGLGACSLAQIGYRGMGAGKPSFSADPADCPDASKIGSVTVKSPLVDHPLPGAVYLAMPHENPFDSLLAIYVTVEDPQTGVVVKLTGKVAADPGTGQLSTTVEQSPQLPFEDFELDFFEGARAPLRTPSTCGTHATAGTYVPWSSPAGATAVTHYYFDTTTPAAGLGSCPASAASVPAASFFEAGTITPTAGAFSPLIVNLSRGDGTQEFGRLTLKPPPGLLAKLAGIPYCSEAALVAASSRSGRSEEADPSCSSASQVGTATVGAGAGPAPYHVTGRVYLAGPYEGAPLSLAVITPAVAGPFDLGTVVVRSALHVDPATTQITATTDPIPHILQGIPLDVRSIVVKLDHSGWGLNPTSCEPSSFDGSMQSVLGGSSSLSSHFQVGDCAKLGFKPGLSLSLMGKTKRTGFPALHAVYAPKAGDANLKSLVLRFPRSEFIAQGHFRTICTRVQWVAGNGGGEQCPAGSIYGKIKASTPLLDDPLEGPVYLRSSNHNLPDVVFALKGQVDAEVSVRIDSQKGGLRASIESAPDVPVSKVVLDMQGGQKGLFVNSRDICAKTYRASAALGAQSGREAQLRPPMRAQCEKRKRKGKGHGHGKPGR
jgi:hypothetical protein